MRTQHFATILAVAVSMLGVRPCAPHILHPLVTRHDEAY